jgi:hypothetical protein
MRACRPSFILSINASRFLLDTVLLKILYENFNPNPAEHKHAALDALPAGEIEFVPQLEQPLSVFAVTFDHVFCVQFVHASPGSAAAVLNLPATHAAPMSVVAVIAPVTP